MNIKEKEKYIEDYEFQFCDEASKYEKVAKIGQGTFGEVFKARERKNTKKFVAMKKVLMDNEKEGALKQGFTDHSPPVKYWWPADNQIIISYIRKILNSIPE